KMRKTQGAALAGRPYARAALQILARLSGGADLARHPLTAVRPPKKLALVILTSDKGLAGALNSGVLKAAADALAAYPKEAVMVFGYGKKGYEHFARRGYEIARQWENRKDEVELPVMEELSGEVARRFIDKEFDQVLVAYSNFKSTFEQAPTVRTLLPLSLDGVQKLVQDIVPEKGKFSELGAPEAVPAYSVEPEDADILDSLVPRLAAAMLYHFFLEAKASEHSARMVAMKNASDKSKEVVRDLTRTYNKLRQAAITREVSEIVGGREALAA
ncbi:MAG TPA: ATP synthase F1 subunit gamma, partial [Candidatus Paceibacterota bacterium]|nr:ATP synthase F1 subunit gamma [Candidatus Paceibacterota bacterium]